MRIECRKGRGKVFIQTRFFFFSKQFSFLLHIKDNNSNIDDYEFINIRTYIKILLTTIK